VQSWRGGGYGMRGEDNFINKPTGEVVMMVFSGDGTMG